MKGFCPAAGAGLLGPGIVGKPPWLSDPVAPLAGNELYCCKGVAPCAGIEEAVVLARGVKNVLLVDK